MKPKICAKSCAHERSVGLCDYPTLARQTVSADSGSARRSNYTRIAGQGYLATGGDRAGDLRALRLRIRAPTGFRIAMAHPNGKSATREAHAKLMSDHLPFAGNCYSGFHAAKGRPGTDRKGATGSPRAGIVALATTMNCQGRAFSPCFHRGTLSLRFGASPGPETRERGHEALPSSSLGPRAPGAPVPLPSRRAPRGH
jgi:hypothetical protein